MKLQQVLDIQKKMFAYEHSDIKPDILTIGKGLTGGTLTMAAMITSKNISDVISNSEIGVLMHGPTFMANPLACSVANASIEILLNSSWEKKVSKIENVFQTKLNKVKNSDLVKDVRCIGAIGVIELENDIYAKELQEFCVENGVWLRPFGRLFYSIVAYTISEKKLLKITNTMIEAIKYLESKHAK
jgi:adenosylmethionine---8-amino-7-oxononanoate aminotransferase